PAVEETPFPTPDVSFRANSSDRRHSLRGTDGSNPLPSRRESGERWLGNACGTGTMLHGAPTVYLGIKHFQHDRQLGRLFTFENPSRVDARSAIGLQLVGPVAHHAARSDEVAAREAVGNAWHAANSMTCRRQIRKFACGAILRR